MTEEKKDTQGYSENGDMTAISSYVQSIFNEFKLARQPYELIWEECWNNYLGVYQASTTWKRKTEGTKNRSKIFIKLTTLKCNTAHSKVVDLYAGRGGVPFDAEAINPETYGINIEAAKKVVDERKKKIAGHFRKIELDERMDSAILEMAILGTAVLKGPIVERQRVMQARKKTISGMPIDEIDPEVNPYEVFFSEEDVPVYDHIPLWEYYCDPNARSTADSIGEIHFQRQLPANFMKLAYSPGYRKEAVLEAARRASTSDENEYKDKMLSDNYMGKMTIKDNRVSVLEFQGLVPVSMLKAAGVEVPEDVLDEDAVEAIVVLAADGIVIKACVNPLGKRQFRVCPYKKRPHSILGQGVAEAMRDSQKMVNSSARMYIDNKAISGNGMIGINMDRINTKKTRDTEVYAGKTWYVKGNFAPKEAIDSVAFKDVTSGLREMMELFERFADEETGIPKYTSGEMGSFLNKTATGMSMLMTQANINLKTVIKNIDDFWIEPIVEDIDAWFGEFSDEDPMYKIPIRIKATGTESLMAKEIKLESYTRAMQVIASNPQIAMFVDMPKMAKDMLRLLDADVMRSDDEIAQIMEELTKQAGQEKNLREVVSIDRLYPLLHRNEQVQILKEIGIQPEEGAPALTAPGAVTSSASPEGQATKT